MSDRTSDEALVDQVLTGEAEAFSELVRRYETKVRGYCLNMLHDLSSSEDAAQEIFLKAYKGLSSFRKEASFSTWLYRIASNHCINAGKKNSLERARRLPSKEDPHNSLEESAGAVSEEVAFPLDSQQMLRQVLSALPPNYRSIILLREVNGLSYEELAESLGCSLESVRARLKRARKKLLEIRKALEEAVNKEVAQNE